MNGLIFIILFSLLIINTSLSQGNITFNTKSEIIWAGVDRPGDLFLVLNSGGVEKYDTTGKLIGHYNFKSPPTLFEPLDGTKSFYYFQPDNIYGELSYDLSTATSFKLEPYFAVSPILVCSSNHDIWILDAGNGEIKKTNSQNGSIALESVVHDWKSSQIKNIKYMREYQNYLFILNTAVGVEMYDPIGNYVTTFLGSGIASFNFLGEEIYYTLGDKIILTDLYTFEKRKIQMEKSYLFALIVENYIFCADGKEVTIFPLKAK